jgi:hypothetical protein
MSYYDDPSKSPSERLNLYRRYLESTGTDQNRITQMLADWAYAQGFPELAMGGRRSRKGVKRSRKVKKSKGRKTRSHK